VLLCLAFLRVDPGALRRHFVRPWLVLAAVAWMMIVTPLAAGLAFAALGLDASAPGLLVALIFSGGRAPVIATPAFAALLGLDAALSLATAGRLRGSHAAHRRPVRGALSKVPVEISAAALGVKLLALLAGAASPPRSCAGPPDRLGRPPGRAHRGAERDLAVRVRGRGHGRRGGARDHASARGARLIALAFAMSLGLGAATALVFARAGRTAALTLCNLGGAAQHGRDGGGGRRSRARAHLALHGDGAIPVYLLRNCSSRG